MAGPGFITDGCGPFPAGMNAGINPHLLEKTQTAKSFNATHRGAYISHRPSFRKINLNFFGGDETQVAATKNLFQGAGYYQPDFSSAGIIASIAGKIFMFTPDAVGGATVLDISIPGDPNPPTIPQSWIWQAEKYAIINDGQSFPIFYDGISSRRSLSSQVVLGVTSADFVIPAIGFNVPVTLVNPFLGSVDDTVLINGTTFQVVPAPGTFQANLTNFDDVPGTLYPVNTPIYINPNVFGTLVKSTTFGPGVYPAGTVFASPPGLFVLPSSATIIPTGTIISIPASTGFSFHFRVTGHNNSTFPGFPGRAYGVQLITGMLGPITFNIGARVSNTTTTTPVTVAGVLSAPYIAPPVGAKSPATLVAQYTGTSGQAVTIGTANYSIAAIPSPPPGTAITLKNINGIQGTNVVAPVNLLSVPELPPGRMGAYVMGRNWMALPNGRNFMASDIVGGSSGTVANDFRDSVLRATENDYLAGGGNFTVPGNNGDITAIKATAILDVSLGQGPVQVFTPLSIFSCNAPVDRQSWQGITNPILTQSLIGGGSLSQNGTVNSNADILFRSLEGIRSYILSRADFDKWSSTPISREVQPIVDTENKSLIQYSSAIVFDNRCLVSSIPTNGPLGVYCRGIYALNFDTISSLRGKESSVYDGFWTGLNVLQFVTGLFSGIQRAFAFCYEEFTNEISLYEILPGSPDNNFDNGNVGITWGFETAALFNSPSVKGEFDLIELIDGEIYFSEIRGAVNVQTWYKPDYLECWVPWATFSICSNNIGAGKPKQYRSRLGLGSPSIEACDETNNRPYRIGNNFQFKVQITGSCKFMGAQFKANRSLETKYAVVQCDNICDTSEMADCETVVVTSCQNFPLNFYSLNSGKTYSNASTLVEVTDPNGRSRSVPVASGAVNFSFPYPPNYPFEYPVSIFLCAAGGIIASEIPIGATQDQIDAIADSVVSRCVRAIAESGVSCEPVIKYNEEVFNSPCSGSFVFFGALPVWISINGDNTQFVGKAGVYSAPTVDEANAKAQAALNAFVARENGFDDILCVPLALQIEGYFDGLIPIP